MTTFPIESNSRQRARGTIVGKGRVSGKLALSALEASFVTKRHDRMPEWHICDPARGACDSTRSHGAIRKTTSCPCDPRPHPTNAPALKSAGTSQCRVVARVEESRCES